MCEHKRASLQRAENARVIPYLSATFFVLRDIVHVRHDIRFLRTADIFGLLLSFNFFVQRLCHSDDDSARETS